MLVLWEFDNMVSWFDKKLVNVKRVLKIRAKNTIKNKEEHTVVQKTIK